MTGGKSLGAEDNNLLLLPMQLQISASASGGGEAPPEMALGLSGEVQKEDALPSADSAPDRRLSMNTEREGEIILLAQEAALFFKSLVEGGVPPMHASALTGNWILSQRIQGDGTGEEWREGRS